MSDHVASIRTYITVFAALLVLLVLTIAAAEVDLGLLNPVVAMTIAVAKAVLIVLFFMHLRWSSQLTRIFAAAGLLWLILLMALAMSDYLARGSAANSDPFDKASPRAALSPAGRNATVAYSRSVT